MRQIAMMVAGACAALSYGQAVRMPAQDGGAAADQNYANAFSAQHQITVTGTVTGKVKGSPGAGYAEGLAILVRDRHNHVYSVDLGPTWFVANQATSIHMGDKVRVTGSPVTFKDGEHLLLARVVRKGRQALTLRDDDGYPYWTAYRKGQYAVAGNSNSISGRILSINPVMAEGQQQFGYQIQTPTGIANVAVAPSWYLDPQPLGFQVGDNVVVAGAAPIQMGNVILAGGIYDSTYGGTVVLRPNGVPVWGGFQNNAGVVVRP